MKILASKIFLHKNINKQFDLIIQFFKLKSRKINFLMIALNRVLTLPDYRSRRELPESSGIFEKCLIFVG